MYNTLPMKYFGRGAGKIIMPRAVLRENRNEWFVKPSVVILIMAISCFLIIKTTIINNKKLFKDTKTIVLIPDAPPPPEPTVKKKIPLIKVLKTAVKKTIEPKRIELKKIIAKKPKPKLVKPKKLIPKKIKPLDIKKHSLKPKKLDLKKLTPKKLQTKKVRVRELKTNKIATKKLNPKKLTTNKIAPKKLAAKTPVNKQVLNKAPKPQKMIANNINPRNRPKLAHQQTPKSASPKAITAPAPQFTAMNNVKRSGVKLPSTVSKHAPTFAPAPKQTGPAPVLQQRTKYRPQVETSLPSYAAPKAARIAPAPEPSISNIHVEASDGTELYEEMLIIKSTALGSSRRVRNLKRAIMKKAKNMSSRNSPYQYKVKGYRCTVIIKSNKQVIIEFSPADASFDVVSALERILPR